MHKIIKIVNTLDDFTMKEPYQAAIPGVSHGALYEKARAGRNRRPFLLACVNASRPLSWVPP
jgi:arginine/lysine/ornithine decarboxylase